MFGKPKKNLSYYPEMMLQFIGLHPHRKSKFSILYNPYINCSIFLLLLILALLEVLLNYNTDILRAIEGLSSVVYMTFASCRYVLSYFCNKPALAHLLTTQSKFWKIENFQGQIRKECEHVMVLASDFIGAYKNYVVVLSSMFYLQSFIFRELQIKLYVPQGWFYFLYFICFYITPVLFVSVNGVTSMFCALCVPVTVQFKLLAYKFKNLRNRREIKKLIDYHNFLVGYCRKINEYSSAVLLLEFFITVSLCCILIFMASNEYPLIDKIKCAAFIISQFIDTAVYFYNAELISEASMSVGTAAYRSLWYESEDPQVGRNVALVIARAQKEVAFSGFGIVWINMMTFTKIFKVTLSFNSYLNTITVKDANF